MATEVTVDLATCPESTVFDGDKRLLTEADGNPLALAVHHQQKKK